MEIELKRSDIILVYESLIDLGKRNLSEKCWVNVSKNIRVFKPEVSVSEEENKRLVDNLGEKDDDGNQKYIDGPRGIKLIDFGKNQKKADDMTKLAYDEIVKLNVHIIKLSDLRYTDKDKDGDLILRKDFPSTIMSHILDVIIYEDDEYNRLLDLPAADSEIVEKAPVIKP